MLKDYIPPVDKPIALFLSCSKHKPYNKSPYRRVFLAMLENKLKIRDISQIYTISEPAILVPQELDETVITKYEFPPDMLQSKGRQIFIERLSKLLPKIIRGHKISFYVLPKHHRGIFEEALELITPKDKKELDKKQIVYAPPVTYNLPRARKIIEEVLFKQKIMSEE
jgi:predicted RNA-binding protein